MPVSFTLHSTPVASTANQSTAYTGTSAAVVAGEILIGFVTAATNGGTGTMSGGGFTWTVLSSQTKLSNADAVLVFWAQATSSTSFAPSFTPAAGGAQGCMMTVIRVAGGTGDASVPGLQQTIVTNTASTANPTVTFGTATLTTSGILLLAANGTNSTAQFTAPTGFTELSETAFNTPTNGAQVSTRTSGGTLTTYTWTNANTTSWRTFGLEFTEGIATAFDPMGQMGFFGL